MSCHQITCGKRYTIYSLNKQRCSVSVISEATGRYRRTIYRELKHNKCNDGKYRPSINYEVMNKNVIRGIGWR